MLGSAGGGQLRLLGMPQGVKEKTRYGILRRRRPWHTADERHNLAGASMMILATHSNGAL